MKADTQPMIPEEAGLLFEIGCEELPVDYIVPALGQLEKNVTRALAALRLVHGTIQTDATPRRLVLRIDRLASRQRYEIRDVLGPKSEIAFSPGGELTPSGLGFLRKLGLAAEQARVRDGRLWAQVEDAGRPVHELLPHLLLELIRSFSFPKSMRWEESGERFARPVRWLLAQYGTEIIPMTFAGVQAGGRTVLHPLSALRTVEIPSPESYEALLRKNHVILSASERRTILRAALESEAKAAGGRWVQDDELLDRVVMMAEFPRVLTGRIGAEFLSMPREIITTAMREHQRYFAVEGSDGRLLPVFLAVHDNPGAANESIRPGCERVLEARLKDAEFFYHEDMKHALCDKVPELARVMWIKGLGSLLDKTRRLEQLGAWLADRLEPESLETVRQAAYLSKADLVTLMVQEKEYTSLQGVMGSFYAKAQGVAEAAATAIGEHYLPRGADDRLPMTPAGRVLALADKLDHLVGCWSAGLIPTGAKDPYALRRAAQGFIAVTLAGGYRYSLRSALQESLKGFEIFGATRSAVIQEVQHFIQGRLESELASRGFPPDLIQSILGIGWDDLTALVKKAEALTVLREDNVFIPAVTAFSRVVNILGKDISRTTFLEAPDLEILPGCFVAPVEAELADAILTVGKDLQPLQDQGRFNEGFMRLAALQPLIDRFFVDVLVMDPDEKIRRNRMNLLTNLARRIWLLADFSKLVLSQ